MGINYFLNGQKTSKHKMLITFYTVDYFSKLFCRKHSSETGKKREGRAKLQQTINNKQNKKKMLRRSKCRCCPNIETKTKTKMCLLASLSSQSLKINTTQKTSIFERFLGFSFFVGSYETSMSV